MDKERRNQGKTEWATHVFTYSCGGNERKPFQHNRQKQEGKDAKAVPLFSSKNLWFPAAVTAASPPDSACRTRWCSAAERPRTCRFRAGKSRKCQTASSTRECSPRAD